MNDDTEETSNRSSIILCIGTTLKRPWIKVGFIPIGRGMLLTSHERSLGIREVPAKRYMGFLQHFADKTHPFVNLEWNYDAANHDEQKKMERLKTEMKNLLKRIRQQDGFARGAYSITSVEDGKLIIVDSQELKA